MVGTNERSVKGYTFDTCVGIKMCENPNLGDLLACRINFTKVEIHISSQTLTEVKRLGYDIATVSEQIHQSTGAKVICGTVTAHMKNDAAYLETVCPTLHTGDSSILAYARATGTSLVTCDRGLAEAARLADAGVVNPDILPCDKIAQKKKSHSNVVKKVIAKPVAIKQKARKLAIRPGQKIVWSAFV
jgi:hypothetical protein